MHYKFHFLGIPLDDKTLSIFTETLKRNTSLHTIIFTNCDMMNRSATRLVEVLECNITLRKFDLGLNYISRDVKDRLMKLGASKGIKIEF